MSESPVVPNSYDILQAVITATPDAIFVKDLEGRYVLVNDASSMYRLCSSRRGSVESAASIARPTKASTRESKAW